MYSTALELGSDHGSRVRCGDPSECLRPRPGVYFPHAIRTQARRAPLCPPDPGRRFSFQHGGTTREQPV